jgi:hypothetical protein
MYWSIYYVELYVIYVVMSLIINALYFKQSFQYVIYQDYWMIDKLLYLYEFLKIDIKLR